MNKRKAFDPYVGSVERMRWAGLVSDNRSLFTGLDFSWGISKQRNYIRKKGTVLRTFGEDLMSEW